MVVIVVVYTCPKGRKEVNKMDFERFTVKQERGHWTAYDNQTGKTVSADSYGELIADIEEDLKKELDK